MNRLLEKIYKVIELLEAERYVDSDASMSYKVSYDHVPNQQLADLEQMQWIDYEQGTFWGTKDQHCWFKTQVVIPESFAQKKVIFSISTGHQEGWDVSNPQFLIYINGELRQGLDVNHKNTLLDESATVGDIFDIYLLGYSGLKDDPVILKSCIKTVEPRIEAYYYNLSNLFWALSLMDEANFEYPKLLKDCLFCVELLDLRQLHSAAFFESLDRANQFLVDTYYTLIREEGPVVTTIGHTHIDVAWLWTIDQTKEKVVRSFSTVLELMKLYPDYKFMSSQPQLYAYVKESNPELYQQIKEKIEEGRWEVDGGMWLEADCNLPSGESLSRQFLYGIRFIKTEFGKTSSTLWLPDVFGYSAALPQLIRKSGLRYMMTSKLDWNQFNKIPHDTFVWKGIDGSGVLTHLITTSDDSAFDNNFYKREPKFQQTTYNGRLNPNQVKGTYTRYQDRLVSDETLQLFGFGDGGGGPTEAMLENYKRLKFGLPGIPRVSMDMQNAFFSRLSDKVSNNPYLKTWQGELFLEFHQGTYTSMAENKKYNRECEFLLQECEWINSFATHFGHEYPKDAIEEQWKRVLLYQFHDIIPGSSIREVYDETRIGYCEIGDRTNALLTSAMNKIYNGMKLQGEACIVFNGGSFTRSDVVSFPKSKMKHINFLLDSDNKQYPLYEYRDKDEVFAYLENIPSKGYKTFYFVGDQEGKDQTQQMLNASQKVAIQYEKDRVQRIENVHYRLVFNEQMEFISIYDKQECREILKQNGRGNVLQLFEDRPLEFDNWNIDATYKDKIYEIGQVESARVVEDNPIFTSLEVRRKYGQSEITQHIVIYTQHKRIDFKTYVDWHEQHVLLKTAFEVDVNTTVATYDIQYGNITRPTHSNTSWEEAMYEVCGHKWADISETGYGVSLLNDCKYGYDIKDGTMRLTLIKCGTYPNETADQGLHEFTYALYGHGQTWRESDTVKLAYNLNVPLKQFSPDVLRPISVDPYGEFVSLNPLKALEASLVSSDLDQVIIDTIKAAEEGPGFIIRIFENNNMRGVAEFLTLYPIKRVSLCDLVENEIETIPSTQNSFKVAIKGYEVITLKVEFTENKVIYED